MAVVQSQYSESIPDLVAGQIATSSPCIVDSYEVDGDTSTMIPFGRAVQRHGSTDRIEDGVDMTGVNAAPWHPVKYLGVTVKDPARPVDRAPRTPATSENLYRGGAIAAVITQGDVAVIASGTNEIARGAPVYVTDIATGELGTASTGSATTARVPGAFWRTAVPSAARGNDRLAIVRLTGEIVG